MSQMMGQGRPRGSWGRGQKVPRICCFQKSPCPIPEHHLFPERPEAHPQAPPTRPQPWVHPGNDAEPSCPYNLQLMITPAQGSAPSRVHRRPLCSPSAAPSPGQYCLLLRGGTALRGLL